MEGLAACLLGVPRWKARVWKAKCDKDHAAFRAGTKNTVDLVNHLAHIEPAVPSTLPEILQLVGAEKGQRKKRTVMSTYLMCEEDCSTH